MYERSLGIVIEKLGVVDFVLMRRYARVDPGPREEQVPTTQPAPGF